MSECKMAKCPVSKELKQLRHTGVLAVSILKRNGDICQICKNSYFPKETGMCNICKTDNYSSFEIVDVDF